MTIKRTDINEYTDYVKSIYPEMVVDYWFQHGELIFYKTQYDFDHMKDVMSCYKKDGKFVIVDEF